MGMYMSYREADAAAIERLIARGQADAAEEEDCSGAPDSPEIEEAEAGRETCYLEKMWDGLHCLLTGVGACEPSGEKLLSEAVIGGQAYSDEGAYFVSYVSPERTPQILAALEAFDLEAAIGAFSPEHFERKNIYPHIWLREDKELLRQELRAAFRILRDFYGRMAEKKRGVIIRLY